MRQIFFAGEETQEWPALLRDVVADGAAEHRILGFKRVEYRPLCNLTFDLKPDIAANLGKGSQVWRECDSDHGGPHVLWTLQATFRQPARFAQARVCTSTESTAGRSRTMGAQLSPASEEAYTCPPVVPK